MKVGYWTARNPMMASYRLRVDVPRQHLGVESDLGRGDVTFFYKNGAPEVARHLPAVVFDVVNDHFHDSHEADYREMCRLADTVTVSSEAMARTVFAETGRQAIVVDDPYETAEFLPQCMGDEVVWFGHPANFKSLEPYEDANPSVYAMGWTQDGELRAIQSAAVVLLTASNPGASANRVIKAIRAGRFVVAPEDSPQAWREISGIWVGDVREGIAWALTHRDDACQRVKAAQEAIRERFSPQTVAKRWTDVFVSTLDQATRKRRAG